MHYALEIIDLLFTSDKSHVTEETFLQSFQKNPNINNSESSENLFPHRKKRNLEIE